jgi:hypothetical protein
MMSKAGCSTALIKMVFDDYAEEHGLDRTLYSYDYVARVFNRVDRSVADLDLDGLSQHLKEREEELGLNYELHLDPSGNLDMCFAQLADAMKDWARGGNSNILLFDPTAGTNRLGMKLCMFVTVSPTGKTTTAALALIRRENRHSFEWCLRSFAKAFRTPPSLFITDSDDEIAAAVDIVSSPRDVWTGVVHNLCVFHISKNLHGHLRKLFGANMKGWHELMNRFWRIAKESDISSRESFDADWESMCAFVTHTATVSEKLEHEMDWLQTRLYVRRHKWAARWVFGQFTAGCHSTQRAESNQAAKKASLRKNSSVSALMTHIERENVAGRDKAAISEEVLRMRQSISGGASIAVVRSLMRTLTPYAFKLVLQQAAQAVFYTSKVCDDFESEEDSIHRIVFEGCDVHNHQFIVTRTGNTDVDTLHFGEGGELPSSFDAPSDFGLSETRSHRWTTLKWCSCQFSVAFGGLPCRHILYLCMTQEVQEYPTDDIHPTYLNLSDDDVLSMTRRLYATPAPPNVRPFAPGVAPRRLSRVERFKLLMNEFQPICELGCDASVVKFEGLVDLLRSTWKEVSGSNLNPVSFLPSNCPRVHRDSVDDVQSRPSPAMDPNPQSSPTDEKSIVSGSEWE